MCCVLRIGIVHVEDVTAATDESAVEASIPLGSQVDVADVGVRYVMSSCFLPSMLWFRGRPAVCAERRTWADLQKPVRSATGRGERARGRERERESQTL